jgi:hypothetical protein
MIQGKATTESSNFLQLPSSDRRPQKSRVKVLETYKAPKNTAHVSVSELSLPKIKQGKYCKRVCILINAKGATSRCCVA